ncbi:MAP kinase [Aureococcus anophagefferens]|nr:MAP kinase [Aureococcus anophagefferens]
MWAVGCILGEMLNGKPIFPGTSTVNQLEKVLELTGKPSKEDVDAVGSPYAAQMLDSIGNFNPANRVSAVDALNDAWVAEFHKSEEEPDYPGGPIKIVIDDNTKLTAQDYRNNLYMQISQIKKDARRRDQARGANAENAKPAENANADPNAAAGRGRGDRAARGGRRQGRGARGAIGRRRALGNRLFGGVS